MLRVTAAQERTKRHGSQWLTRESHALELEPGVFTREALRGIAQSLKRSVEVGRRRRTPPFRSAMAMLCFDLNQAGRQVSAQPCARLKAAKEELRGLFDRQGKAACSPPPVPSRAMRLPPQCSDTTVSALDG